MKLDYMNAFLSVLYNSDESTSIHNCRLAREYADLLLKKSFISHIEYRDMLIKIRNERVKL